MDALPWGGVGGKIASLHQQIAAIIQPAQTNKEEEEKEVYLFSCKVNLLI